MISATVSSQSCFCWLYRASPSLAAKNIINLISVLTIWWCPCVEFSLVLLEEGVWYDQCVLWQNSISLCPASFCIPRPNLPVIPDVSWLPTFAFQSPIMKRISFLGVSSKRSLGLHRTVQLQLLQRGCLPNMYFLLFCRVPILFLRPLDLHAPDLAPGLIGLSQSQRTPYPC